ncbi:MAG: hypothetical protein A3E83_04290 [Gammaproteobacteria bacterium RIFCSPHIGHO2_12_FULL_41_20]|nr:MAG: hypothetical protein A3E83_04290 [Gammaproteobacteria bacterium RIFCSPHIGHO2_12_FULL_41_20]
MVNGWVSLSIAIVFGVFGTIFLKLSDGLKKWRPVFFLIISYGICFSAMTLALRSLDLSVAYAVWSGLGTLFVAIISFFLFKEPFSLHKIIFLLLIVLGVIGIHLSDVIDLF